MQCPYPPFLSRQWCLVQDYCILMSLSHSSRIHFLFLTVILKYVSGSAVYTCRRKVSHVRSIWQVFPENKLPHLILCLAFPWNLIHNTALAISHLVLELMITWIYLFLVCMLRRRENSNANVQMATYLRP